MPQFEEAVLDQESQGSVALEPKERGLPVVRECSSWGGYLYGSRILRLSKKYTEVMHMDLEPKGSTLHRAGMHGVTRSVKMQVLVE